MTSEIDSVQCLVIIDNQRIAERDWRRSALSRDRVEGLMRTWAWAQQPRYAQTAYGDRIHDSRAGDELPPFMALGRAMWGLITSQRPERRVELASDPNSVGRYEPIPCVAPPKEVTPVVRSKNHRATDPSRIYGTESEVALAVGGILAQMIREHSAEYADALKDNATTSLALFLTSNRCKQLDDEVRSICSRDGSAKKRRKRITQTSDSVQKIEQLRELMMSERDLTKRMRTYANNAVYQSALVYFGEIAERRQDARECIFGRAAA